MPATVHYLCFRITPFYMRNAKWINTPHGRRMKCKRVCKINLNTPRCKMPKLQIRSNWQTVGRKFEYRETLHNHCCKVVQRNANERGAKKIKNKLKSIFIIFCFSAPYRTQLGSVSVFRIYKATLFSLQRFILPRCLRKCFYYLRPDCA